MIKAASDHPKGTLVSNRLLARHMNVPEATVRRWRNSSAPRDADTVRLAVRGGKTHAIETANIRRSAAQRRTAPKPDHLQGDFKNMKDRASPEALGLLTIMGSWMFEGMPATVCLDRIEEVVGALGRRAAAAGVERT